VREEEGKKRSFSWRSISTSDSPQRRFGGGGGGGGCGWLIMYLFNVFISFYIYI